MSQGERVRGKQYFYSKKICIQVLCVHIQYLYVCVYVCVGASIGVCLIDYLQLYLFFCIYPIVNVCVCVCVGASIGVCLIHYLELYLFLCIYPIVSFCSDFKIPFMIYQNLKGLRIVYTAVFSIPFLQIDNVFLSCKFLRHHSIQKV